MNFSKPYLFGFKTEGEVVSPFKIMQNIYIRLLLSALLHSERPKLYTILAFLSAVGLILRWIFLFQTNKQKKKERK